MSKDTRTRHIPSDLDLNAAFGISSPTPAPVITDLVEPTPMPSKPVSTERQRLTTQELQLAVALIANGYGDPEITKIGRTQGGKPKVEFGFDLPEGKTAKAVEAEFWSKRMTGEISTVFSITRSLKKRIDRLADLAE